MEDIEDCKYAILNEVINDEEMHPLYHVTEVDVVPLNGRDFDLLTINGKAVVIGSGSYGARDMVLFTSTKTFNPMK